LKNSDNRWVITLIVAAVAQAVSAGGISLVFPFLPIYIQTLEGSDALSPELFAGLVIAAPPLMATFSAPFWGRLADQYGRKKMVMRAMFTASIVLFFMTFSQTAFMLVFMRGLQGLTTGIVAANTALVAGEAPRHRVGFALGTLQVGLWSGVAIGPIFGGILADNFGFQVPFLFTSVMVFIGGLLITFGVRENFTPDDKPLNLNPAVMIRGWREILKIPSVKTVYSLRFLNGFAQRSIIPIAPLFVVALLPTVASSGTSYAGLVLTVSSVAATVGSIWLGWLGDKRGHRNVLLGSALVATIFYIPQAFVTDITQLLILQGLAGVAAGGVMAVPAAMLANYTNLGDEGSVYGLDASVSSSANGLAPLTGSIIASIFGLRAVFMAVAFYYLAIVVITTQFLSQPKKINLGISSRLAAGD
jgi:MFS transporter, DHA1 family, multidrug resistance protein